MSENRKTSVDIGILADPELPTELAEGLAQRLPEYLERSISRDVLWKIHCQTRSLQVNEQGNIPFIDVAAQILPEQGWDILLCVTDLPRRVGNMPVLADVSTEHRVALASVPALGGVHLRSRLRDTLAYLIAELGRAGHLPTEVNWKRPRAGSFLTPVRWVDQPDPELEASLTLTGLGGTGPAAGRHGAQQPAVAPGVGAVQNAHRGVRHGSVRHLLQQHLESG